MIRFRMAMMVQARGQIRWELNDPASNQVQFKGVVQFIYVDDRRVKNFDNWAELL